MMENKNIVTAAAMKGFSSKEVCWQYINDISSRLEELHSAGMALGRVELANVKVEGNSFSLIDNSPCKGSLSGDIWNLAASAFELMLGVPLFNGLGERAQKESTPLPSLPGSGMESLNALLRRCMCYKKENRPSMSEINRIAAGELEKCASQPRRKRSLPKNGTSKPCGKYDKEWPESMTLLRNSIISLLFLLLSSAQLQAQTHSVLDSNDEETTIKLIEATLLLRSGEEKKWNEARNEFSKRIGIFTLMDELKDRSHDCALLPSQVKCFGINRMIKELKSEKSVQNTGKGLLDGSDTRFNYSIYEKGIKRCSEALYEMSGRYGKQIFAVVPFSPSQNYETELCVAGGIVYEPSYKGTDGVTYYCIESGEAPAQGSSLQLKIKNNDSNNASFVIINHNYRNR